MVPRLKEMDLFLFTKMTPEIGAFNGRSRFLVLLSAKFPIFQAIPVWQVQDYVNGSFPFHSCQRIRYEVMVVICLIFRYKTSC